MVFHPIDQKVFQFEAEAYNNFFETNVQNSADITPNLVNGSFTVSNEGTYSINGGLRLSSNTYSANFAMALFVTRASGGGSTLWKMAGGAYEPPFIFSGHFEIYLKAGDMVQLGYYASSTLGTITGDAAGVYSYFNIALTNKSLA